uniref:Uncharacterized protein n=1 Tax=Plectus sambesii TaxID=2011161 RepID=A0A914X6N6_9BILA
MDSEPKRSPMALSERLAELLKSGPVESLDEELVYWEDDTALGPLPYNPPRIDMADATDDSKEKFLQSLEKYSKGSSSKFTNFELWQNTDELLCNVFDFRRYGGPVNLNNTEKQVVSSQLFDILPIIESGLHKAFWPLDADQRQTAKIYRSAVQFLVDDFGNLNVVDDATADTEAKSSPMVLSEQLAELLECGPVESLDEGLLCWEDDGALGEFPCSPAHGQLAFDRYVIGNGSPRAIQGNTRLIEAILHLRDPHEFFTAIAETNSTVRLTKDGFLNINEQIDIHPHTFCKMGRYKGEDLRTLLLRMTAQYNNYDIMEEQYREATKTFRLREHIVLSFD